jgi:hypothetical protein
MTRYAQIKCNIYDDLVNEGYSKDAIDVYLFYSIISPSIIGLFLTRPDRDRVSANMDTVSWDKGIKELQDGGKLLWDGGWVWIVGKAKFVRGPKQMRAAQVQFSELPDSLGLKALFAKRYNTVSMGYTVQDTPIPIPIPKPKPKQKIKDDATRQNQSKIQSEKERAVKAFEGRFPKCPKRLWGVVHNILMGEGQFRSAGCTDLSILLEFIDQIPGDIQDPVSRLIDMVQRTPSYRR